LAQGHFVAVLFIAYKLIENTDSLKNEFYEIRIKTICRVTKIF